MKRSSEIFAISVVLCLIALSGNVQAQSAMTQAGKDVLSDFKWTVNNAAEDGEDGVTSPLHVPDLFASGGMFRQPAFYYSSLGTAALFGSAFALDQTVRSHLREMPNNAANSLETGGGFYSYILPGLVYVHGLVSGDEQARRDTITGYEAAGVASLITLGFKAGFGRLRPREDHHSHTQFFDQGDSFVSGATTPVFALACATSEAFDNRWYVAVPAYAGALAVGFGRIGHDAHWLSDIAGSAIVGVATTELMLWMHRRHDANPSSFRIFTVTAPDPRRMASAAPVGVGISYTW